MVINLSFMMIGKSLFTFTPSTWTFNTLFWLVLQKQLCFKFLATKTYTHTHTCVAIFIHKLMEFWLLQRIIQYKCNISRIWNNIDVRCMEIAQIKKRKIINKWKAAYEKPSVYLLYKTILMWIFASWHSHGDTFCYVCRCTHDIYIDFVWSKISSNKYQYKFSDRSK